jgi:hypothetical protein
MQLNAIFVGFWLKWHTSSGSIEKEKKERKESVFVII